VGPRRLPGERKNLAEPDDSPSGGPTGAGLLGKFPGRLGRECHPETVIGPDGTRPTGEDARFARAEPAAHPRPSSSYQSYASRFGADVFDVCDRADITGIMLNLPRSRAKGLYQGGSGRQGLGGGFLKTVRSLLVSFRAVSLVDLLSPPRRPPRTAWLEDATPIALAASHRKGAVRSRRHTPRTSERAALSLHEEKKASR
jgi:hypothetical protein